MTTLARPACGGVVSPLILDDRGIACEGGANRFFWGLPIRKPLENSDALPLTDRGDDREHSEHGPKGNRVPRINVQECETSDGEGRQRFGRPPTSSKTFEVLDRRAFPREGIHYEIRCGFCAERFGGASAYEAVEAIRDHDDEHPFCGGCGTERATSPSDSPTYCDDCAQDVPAQVPVSPTVVGGRP